MKKLNYYKNAFKIETNELNLCIPGFVKKINDIGRNFSTNTFLSENSDLMMIFLS